MPIREDTETYGRKHPVPQNVMDVEFKVVGDLTVRQVMYLFGGGIMVALFWKSGLPQFWRWAFMIFSGVLSIAIAFVPVQERGLDKWVISFIGAITSPSQRIWRKTYSPPSYFLADYASIIRNEIITLTPAKSRNKLDEFLGQIENSKSHYDDKEDERLKSIRSLYNTPNLTTQKIQMTTPVDQSQQIFEPEPKEQTIPSIEDIKENEKESKEEFMEAFDTNRQRIRLDNIDRTMYNLPSKMKGEIDINTRHRLPSTIIEESLEDLQKKERDFEKKMKEFIAMVEKAKHEFSKHAKTGNQKENQENRIKFLNEKLEQLNKEKANISEKIEESSEQAKNITEDTPKEIFATEVEKVQKKNKSLEDELKKIKQQLESMTMGAQKYTSDANQTERKPLVDDGEESRLFQKLFQTN